MLEVHLLRASVEYTRNDISPLDSGATPSTGPEIVIGDVTGDSQPEILFALQAGDEREERGEGEFWRHPIVLTRNGDTFAEMTAPWVGIPPPSPKLSAVERQGLSYALAVADVDQDGTNEVIVGTGGYRNPSEYGALYVFQWNGAEFQAEYSDYCLGDVSKLVVLGSGTEIALSTAGKPVHLEAVYEGVCQGVAASADEPRARLSLLVSEGRDQYRTKPVIFASERSGPFVVNPQSPPRTQFVWFVPTNVGGPGRDWTSVVSYDLEGQILDNIVPSLIEYRSKYPVAADLDGDGLDEMVILFWRNTESGDVFVWQVFRIQNAEYRVVFQSVESEPTPEGPLYLTAGDIDNNGRDELVDDTGRVYTWTGSRLCYQGNVIDAAGLELGYGFESIAVGDVYGDGQNRLVVTGRPVEERNGNVCRDCLLPGMYVIKVELPPANGICLEE